MSLGIQCAAVWPPKIRSLGIAFSTAIPGRKRGRSHCLQQRQAQQGRNRAEADDATGRQQLVFGLPQISRSLSPSSSMKRNDRRVGLEDVVIELLERVGPDSKPAARPPSWGSRSRSVTRRPAWARRNAAPRPSAPPPRTPAGVATSAHTPREFEARGA